MMRRLLRQNWFVARHNVLLWIICAVTLTFAACSQAFLVGSKVTPGLGFVYAFYAAIYFGDAGTSGRLDAQLMHGASRPHVYLAQFLTLFFCCLLILAATVGGELAVISVSDELHQYVLPGILANAAGLVLNAAAYAGIFTLVGMALAGRRPGRGTLALIVSVCFVLAAAIWGSWIDSRLMEPENVAYVEMGDAAVDVYADPRYAQTLPFKSAPNPSYVHEPERSRLEALERFLPVTQCIWLANLNFAEPTAEGMRAALDTYLYSLILLLLASVSGILIFQCRQLD